MPISKILSAIKRSRRKKKTIQEILSRPQKNHSVVNIHRIDTRNIGDFYSAPHHYFDQLKDTSLDIFDYKNENEQRRSAFVERICDSSVIVGGGGLLNRGGFKRQMKLFESLTQKNKKIVLWGIGHNDKEPSNFGKVRSYNVDVSKFGLVGTRDYNMPGEWVPCVSCMHPIFDENFQEDQEVGIVYHKDTLKKPLLLKKFKDYPSTSNTTNLEELIHFLGKSGTIITDSYHAMYWAMLLGKKVVVIPNSSKFYDFKYAPVFSSFENCLSDVKKAEKYDGLLEECRGVNEQFAEKAFNYLNL